MSQDEKTDFSKIMNPNDFKSIELEVDLDNLTTKVAVRDGHRFYGEKRSPLTSDQKVRFLEFLSEDNEQGTGIIIECPPNTAAHGHSIAATISALNASKPLRISVTGTVFEQETLDNRNQKLAIRLTQFESAEWRALQSIFNERQAQVLSFLKAVKGFG